MLYGRVSVVVDELDGVVGVDRDGRRHGLVAGGGGVAEHSPVVAGALAAGGGPEPRAARAQEVARCVEDHRQPMAIVERRPLCLGQLEQEEAAALERNRLSQADAAEVERGSALVDHAPVQDPHS